MVTRGEVGKGGTVREFGIDRYTRLYLKWITNNDLLNSTWGNVDFYTSFKVEIIFPNSKIEEYSDLPRSRVYSLDKLILSSLQNSK